MLLIVLGVLLILAGAGGIWWYLTVPHTAEAQFALADAAERELRVEAGTKSPADLAARIEEVIGLYRKVGAKFGKGPKAAEAQKHIAKIQEEVAKDPAKAIAALEDLAKNYPDEDNAGFALLDQARLLRAQAEALKSQSPSDADKNYQEALARLEEFRKTFDKSKNAVAALMEIGRIWQDGIEDPPIHSIQTFEQVLKDYPHSTFEPEALFRLAKEYEKISEFERALALYSQLLEQYPKCEFAADATFARGRLLADKLDKHDEAAKDFQKMAQDFPEDPRAKIAGSEARSEEGKAAQQAGQKYGQSRYGGKLPFDTTGDKPLPPAAMLARFTAEKLDAENYDLHVLFTPAEHRITVDGTLKLANKGDDKKELLLMLGSGIDVTDFKVDGTKAETAHAGDALKVTLPSILKKDAEATLSFSYTGRFADAGMMKKMMGGEMLKDIGGPPSTAPAPTTAPASAPASASAAKPDESLPMNPQIALGDYGYALSGASWYPITIIGDVFDAHITLQTPANMEAVSNGALVKREKATDAGKLGTFEFQTKSPVFGLYFAYGPYTFHEKQIGPIDFYSYLRPENAGKSDAYFVVMNNILSFYSEKFAGFPYEKMAVIDAPLPAFLGGVGPASMMFLQNDMVDHPEVPENLLAHELAHQWFGNLIPINIADPGYSQWLSEGFATYCDALYTEHKDGPKAFLLHLQQYQQLYFQFAMMAPKGSGAIRDTAPGSSMYRPVIYEKGALVLHMLRKVMGDDKFFTLMRQYVETCKNTRSTTDDFRKMASAVDGQDLSWFFSEWFDQSFFAHWKVTAVVKTDPGESDTVVTISQPDDLVKMPADVTLIGMNNERQVIRDVMLDKKENTLDVKTNFAPVKVVVDEDNWVLKRLGSDNIWQAASVSPASAPAGAAAK